MANTSARLSPFQKGSDLDEDEIEALHSAMDEVLGGALAHYEEVVGDTIPDKMAEAVALYRSMGFCDTAPYLPEPTAGALCLELRLR